MATQTVTERSDGVTTERVIERDGGTTYVEDRSAAGGLGKLILGLAILAMVAIVAFFLLQSNRNDAVRTEAVTTAASSVADSAATAADRVGDAAGQAADAVAPQR